jgi:hypothetical protein
MLRRSTEIFLEEGQEDPTEEPMDSGRRTTNDLFKLPVYVPHRAKKDPREIKILDPACGSGHFLLYCFGLLLLIYEEAYEDPDLGPSLLADFPTKGDLRRAIPTLALRYNLHGIDIDVRCTQIAALALWLRCLRAYQEMGAKSDRPQITSSNIVCAEPMPGEKHMLKEFVDQLEPKLLGQLIELVFDKMRLAGECGALLKIEDELRDAVAEAKRQWLAGPVSVQRSLFDDEVQTVRPQQFELAGVTDTQFFEQAEAKVVEALRRYAGHTQDSQRFQRRLFAEDAVRGLGFIDLCNKRFDVVLMNPPFGEAPQSALDYLANAFKDTKSDLAPQFGERCSLLLEEGGILGLLSTRTWLFVKRFESWRRRLTSQYNFRGLADLGYGVLDAVVETAAILWERSSHRGKAIFVSALKDTDKETAIKNLSQATVCDTSLFQSLPACVTAYWIPEQLINWYRAAQKVDVTIALALQGVATADNFRFLRLFWEIGAGGIASDRSPASPVDGWVPFAKGGEYRPCHDDIHLLLDWRREGLELKNYIVSQYPYLNGNWGWVVKNSEHYFKAGLTWSYRTTSAFCLKVLPGGCVFSDGGWAMFPNDRAQTCSLLAVYNSAIGRYFMELPLGQGDTSASGTAARNYSSEPVGAVPFLTVDQERIAPLVNQLIDFQRSHDLSGETTRLFVGISHCTLASSLRESALVHFQSYLRQCLHYLGVSRAVQEELEIAARIDQGLLRSIYEQEGTHPCDYDEEKRVPDSFRSVFEGSIEELVDLAGEEIGGLRFTVKKAYHVDRRIEVLAHTLRCSPKAIVNKALAEQWLPKGTVEECAKTAVSFFVGTAFGRWDVRFAIGTTPAPSLPGAFEPIPACSPAMLQAPDGLPSRTVPSDYPLRLVSDGIHVDDADHSDDLIRRVREVLELIWISRAEAIEQEACDILGVKELRDYFRKPGKGGFWDDHVSLYSKSRRKAPIYWLLQSSKKNYGLWLYYHRLDKDMLFKARQNAVDPKIRLEQTRLDSLRLQKSALGADAKGARKIDKDIEKQEALLSELKDFADKLERAAKPNFGNPEKLDSNVVYDPDLNDGVVLNIAPLWELVPWKEAKNYWEELLEGKYEWSSMGKLLRKKGLVT